ncbi:MAG TPA: hypothetical protein VK990_02940 [Acidimicrobiia bacterium]|nr:hypothetical protein [Acidimicrobiia bacterium]
MTRTSAFLLPDPARVITKPFLPGEHVFSNGQSRAEMIIGRVLGLAETEVADTLAATRLAFLNRHDDMAKVFQRSFEQVVGHIEQPEDLSEDRRMLIGA